MSALLSDPQALRITLLVLAAILAVVVILARGRRVPGEASAAPFEPAAEKLWTTGPTAAERAIHGVVLLLAGVVAFGFLVVLLPRRSVESIVQLFQASRASELPQERIALLYLGDEMKGSDFQIRGIIRNISTEPVTKLDATVRLYSPEGVLLETKVVRMDQEIVDPDAISEFLLVFQNYGGQFNTYSVDFSLRNGDPVRYKDRRGVRHLN